MRRSARHRLLAPGLALVVGLGIAACAADPGGSSAVGATSGAASTSTPTSTPSAGDRAANEEYVAIMALLEAQHTRLVALAASKGSSNDVRSYGSHQGADRTALTAETEKARTSLSVPDPSDDGRLRPGVLTPAQEAALRSATGDTFDGYWVDALIAGGREQIALSRDAATSADPTVRSLAQHAVDVVTAEDADVTRLVAPRSARPVLPGT